MPISALASIVILLLRLLVYYLTKTYSYGEIQFKKAEDVSELEEIAVLNKKFEGLGELYLSKFIHLGIVEPLQKGEFKINKYDGIELNSRELIFLKKLINKPYYKTAGTLFKLSNEVYRTLIRERKMLNPKTFRNAVLVYTPWFILLGIVIIKLNMVNYDPQMVSDLYGYLLVVILTMFVILAVSLGVFRGGKFYLTLEGRRWLEQFEEDNEYLLQKMELTPDKISEEEFYTYVAIYGLEKITEPIYRLTKAMIDYIPPRTGQIDLSGLIPSN